MARVLLGVSGGISAYKAVELARLAIKAGHAVRVVQTEAAERFVGRATFEGITGAPVLVDEFEPDPARGAYPGEPTPDHAPISHLELVRRAEPPEILAAIEEALRKAPFAPRSLDGLKVLVTAGGTREPIDAVRYVGNRSSGRMGFALADEAARRGAAVKVVAANVSLPRNPVVRYLDVETAAELAAACT